MKRTDFLKKMQKDDRVGTAVDWELCQRLVFKPINKLNKYKSAVREMKSIKYSVILRSRRITTSSKRENRISLS